MYLLPQRILPSFVLAVSVERLLIVKFPFRSLDNYNVSFCLSFAMGNIFDDSSLVLLCTISKSFIAKSRSHDYLSGVLVHQAVNNNPSARHDQERKMTHTVLAIVTCFSLTQGPSALVFIYQLLYPSASTILRTVSIVANQLVLTGKMLNVVLFCMTSSTFRRKLLQTCKRWIFLFIYCGDRQRVI
ncbi:hypothetical protein COOONC_12202, partial [Cooperia oncophora]